MPIKYGACAAPVPGFELAIADDDGHILPHNTLGDMFLKLPLPPGTLTTLYNDDERFVNSYLTKMPGYYDTGDAVYIGTVSVRWSRKNPAVVLLHPYISFSVVTSILLIIFVAYQTTTTIFILWAAMMMLSTQLAID